MTRWRARTALALLVVLSGGAGCAGSGPTPAPEAALPGGLTAFVDQSRAERVGRDVFVRLVDEADRGLTVTRAEISSDRFGDVVWTGEKAVVNEADLDFVLPPGRCGDGSDARVRLTYRVDGGAERVSETLATDRYGAIGLFLDRDCAEQRLSAAAALEVGRARVVGRGGDSVFELPVTMTPTGSGDGVRFTGFEDTVLFRQVRGSASADRDTAVPLGAKDPPERVLLRLVPARCDPHALAEDKVGTLVGVHVDAPDLGEPASFYLPLSDDQRSALRSFFAVHCEL